MIHSGFPLVFPWFSCGFRCGERRLLGAPPGAAALLRAVPGVAGTALAVLGGQEEPSGDDVAVGSVGKPMGKAEEHPENP